MTTGIDVSEHNGVIDWERTRDSVGFAIIRAGYGNGHIDKQFTRNISECNRLGIPVGIYWFSYACNIADAISEAAACIKAITPYHISYPVFYDYESDSYSYAMTHGQNKIEPSLYAEAFLDTIKKYGYIPGLYSNLNDMNRWFSWIANKYDLWFASWNISKPQMECDIWQKSASGSIAGVQTSVDVNICFKDYSVPLPIVTDEPKYNQSEFAKIWSDNQKRYRTVCEEILNGEWGNGDARRVNLKAAGYDYSLAQSLINALLRG